MCTVSRKGLEILGASSVLALTGNLLLQHQVWALNAFLWSATAIGTVLIVARRWPTPKKLRHHLLWTAILFTFFFAWRDAQHLKVAAILALLCLAAILIYQVQRSLDGRESERTGEPGLISTGARSLTSGYRLLSNDIDWNETFDVSKRKQAKSVLRGALLSVPVLCVFVPLLASADHDFARLIEQLTSINILEVPDQVFRFAGTWWLAVALLRGVTMAIPDHSRTATMFRTQRIRSLFEINAVTASTTLGMINMLFAVFGAIQLPYLFGGLSFVEFGPLSVARYARHGFFELVAVASFSLPLVMLLRHTSKAGTLKALRFFKGMAVANAAFVCLLLLSAAQRMWIYQEMFGLTRLRVYVSASILWLAAVLILFMFYVINGRRKQFVNRSSACFLVVAAALQFLNPDALIARTNISRVASGNDVDIEYISLLSSDAIPTIVKSLPKLPSAERTLLSRHILHWRYDQNWNIPLREWTYSRYHARRVVDKHSSDLVRYAADDGEDDVTTDFLAAR